MENSNFVINSSDITTIDLPLEDMHIVPNDDSYWNWSPKSMVKYKKLNSKAIVPTQGSAAAAGSDLYAVLDTDSIVIASHETAKIGTGLAIELPKFTFGAIFARSGLATKQGLRPANCVGVVDSDYRGEIIVALHNDTNEDRIISNGDRIAQLVVIPYTPIFFIEDDLTDTERGEGGFGSTGV